MPQFLSTSDPDFEIRFTALLGAKREDSPEVDHIVADIIADVRARGDAAVLELTAKFDRLELTADTMRFSEAEIEAECAKVDDADRAASRAMNSMGSMMRWVSPRPPGTFSRHAMRPSASSLTRSPTTIGRAT